MSFQLSSKDDVLLAISALSTLPAAFTTDNVEFSTPRVVTGSWNEVSKTQNTAIRLTASPSSTQLSGTKVFFYNRLSLASLANIPGFAVKIVGITKVHDALTNIFNYTGLRLTTDDVENLDIVADENGAGVIQLSAKPNSIGWIDSVNLPFTKGGITLNDGVTLALLPGLNYPATDQPYSTTAVYAQMYLYGYDFTQYSAQLEEIPLGVLTSGSADATTLVAAINAKDIGSGTGAWVDNNSATSYNLYGAEVTYNGLNNVFDFTNPNYKYVLALKLASAVTIPAGTLYLHYNDPFNPDDF